VLVIRYPVLTGHALFTVGARAKQDGKLGNEITAAALAVSALFNAGEQRLIEKVIRDDVEYEDIARWWKRISMRDNVVAAARGRS
jgi:hypothetical protein